MITKDRDHCSMAELQMIFYSVVFLPFKNNFLFSPSFQHLTSYFSNSGRFLPQIYVLMEDVTNGLHSFCFLNVCFLTF